MKKVVAVVLAVLCVFSIFAINVSAINDPVISPEQKVKIISGIIGDKEGGNVNPPTSEYTPGEDVVFHITPNKGYRIKQVWVNGVAIGPVSEYTFHNIQEDSTIYAEFEKDENPVCMAVTTDYTGYMLFFFENGKVAKVDMNAYATKTNRKKLINAFSDKSRLVYACLVTDPAEFVLSSTAGRVLIFASASIASKTTKNTQGVQVLTLKKGHRLAEVIPFADGMFAKPARYRTKTLPSTGAVLAVEDKGEQLEF